MTEIELDLAFDIDFAETFLHKHGELRPLFRIAGKSRSIVVLSEWSDDLTKKQVFLLIGILAIAEEADQISMFCESWALSGDAAQAETKRGVMPRESGQREEVVSYYRARRTPAGIRHRMALTAMERDAAGKFTGLGKPVVSSEAGEGKVSGALTGILGRERPTLDQVRAAQVMAETIKRGFSDLLQIVELDDPS